MVKSAVKNDCENFFPFAIKCRQRVMVIYGFLLVEEEEKEKKMPVLCIQGWPMSSS